MMTNQIFSTDLLVRMRQNLPLLPQKAEHRTEQQPAWKGQVA